jgi:hypothetical protein
MKKEIIEKITALVISAFGLIAALAWNSAISELFNKVFPLNDGTLIALFIYATVVTIIAVFITIVLAKAIKKEEKK